MGLMPLDATHRPRRKPASTPAVGEDLESPTSCVNTSMRANISIGQQQHQALKSYAQQHHTTMSRLIRESISATLLLPVQDEVRNYIHDGRHTKEVRQLDQVANILGRVR